MSSESLGQRIRAGRLKKNITQRELAEKAKVSMPYISKIESDKETPTDEKLVTLARLLDLNSDELIVTAGRMPADAMDRLTSDPTKALEFLRQLRD